MIWLALIVVTFGLTAFAVWAAGRWLRWKLIKAGIPVRERQQRNLPDLEMSASDDGRKVHIIPIGDAVAHEDRWGECACNPTLLTFPTDTGDTGWVYEHRAILTTGGKR